MEYAGHFWKVAHRTATMKTCLLVFYWGGLAEPFKSLLYWVPEESLNLSGLAFRMELVTVPAHIAPEVAAVRSQSSRSGGALSHSSRGGGVCSRISQGDGACSHSSRGGGDRSQSSQSLMPVPRPSRADNQRAGSSADVCCERLCLLVSYPRRW